MSEEITIKLVFEDYLKARYKDEQISSKHEFEIKQAFYAGALSLIAALEDDSGEFKRIHESVDKIMKFRQEALFFHFKNIKWIDDDE